MSVHAYRRVQKENKELRKKYNTLLKLVRASGITYVEANDIKECFLVPRVNSEMHEWELCLEESVLEQQDGVI